MWGRIGLTVSLYPIFEISELTLTLGKGIDVIVACTRVDQLVMCDIVDLVLLQPSLIDHPWRVRKDLVDPSTMSDRLASLGVGHGWGVFVPRTLAV